MIADGGGDEADLVCAATPFGGLCEDVFGRDDAWRIVIISGPAKAAALLTSARYFYEQTIAHLRAR